MTNQDEKTLVNIAIAIAACIGLWFLFKWIKGNIGGNGGNIFGGPGKEETFGFPTGGAGTVEDKIIGSYNKNIFQPAEHIVFATKLSAANRLAKKYQTKPGTNVIINDALKSVLKLPDNEFMQVIKEWIAIDGLSDIYSSDLATAEITANTRSPFLTRYGQLTGQIQTGIAYQSKTT
jgi:hypothetical protein